MRILLSMLGVAALGGCAATANGPLYAELPKERMVAHEGQGRIVVYRPGEGLVGAARSVRIALDGSKVGACDVDGFLFVDLPPGAHTLEADLPDVPGRCRIPIQLEANKVSFFKVSSRSESLGSGLFLGLLGQALESAGKECGGAYAISAVDTEAAAPVVQRLRLSSN
jgi:hypothetical protein